MFGRLIVIYYNLICNNKCDIEVLGNNNLLEVIFWGFDIVMCYNINVNNYINVNN